MVKYSCNFFWKAANCHLLTSLDVSSRNTWGESRPSLTPWVTFLYSCCIHSRRFLCKLLDSLSASISLWDLGYMFRISIKHCNRNKNFEWKIQYCHRYISTLVLFCGIQDTAVENIYSCSQTLVSSNLYIFLLPSSYLFPHLHLSTTLRISKFL